MILQVSKPIGISGFKIEERAGNGLILPRMPLKPLNGENSCDYLYCIDNIKLFSNIQLHTWSYPELGS